MAVILRPIFPEPDLPALREAQAKRMEEASRLRERVLTPDYTDEIFGMASQIEFGKTTDLMPTTDEVASVWGRGDYAIYDQMGRNVLAYRAEHDKRIDTLTSLPLVVLPGKSGDPDSEQAAEEVRSQWENFDERMTALKAAARFIERGFSALENVYDVQTRGASAGQFGIVEMIDRPISWFGFDYRNRPYFKPSKYGRDPKAIAEHKVTFGRYGSLHSPYGKGIGQDEYSSVWTIDAVNKGHVEAVERNGFMPVVITYPNNWTEGRVLALRNRMKAQWKNAIFVPGEVDSVRVTAMTEGAYATANATGASRMEIIKNNVTWLQMHINGMQYAANDGPGAYAKDKVADGARLYKAPGDAACMEAMLNRGFVRPIMLLNRPTMDETLWPRFSIDASFGEDLRLLLEIMERGVKMGAKISTVTFYDRFKIPGADLETNPEQELLTAPAQGLIAPPTAPPAEDDVTARVQRNFGESGSLIRIAMNDGTDVFLDPGQPVVTENRGVVERAALLQTDDVPLFPVSMTRRAV